MNLLAGYILMDLGELRTKIIPSHWASLFLSIE